MKYSATAVVKKKISITAQLKNKITAEVKITTGVVLACPLYNLIDGGYPDTTYSPIAGFDLIDGN